MRPSRAFLVALGFSLAANPATATGGTDAPDTQVTSRGTVVAEAPAGNSARAAELLPDGQPPVLVAPETDRPVTDRPLFQPPKTDRPVTRLRSASSRSGGEWPELYVLVPERAGRTISAQPSLFWYLDEVPATSASFVFTLTRDSQDAPVAERQIESPAQAGVQRIRLEDLDVTVDPDVLYEWSVSLVDPDSWSKKVYATGGLERVAPPAELAASLAQRDAPYAYAEHGIWYDAFASVSDWVDAAPESDRPKQMRASLLTQVGLGEIASELRAGNK